MAQDPEILEQGHASAGAEMAEVEQRIRGGEWVGI